MAYLVTKPALGKKNFSALSVSGESLQALLQDVLATGASFQFRAKGFSMTPFIKDGDLITVSPTLKVKPSIGKIVAFILPETTLLVVHRVVAQHGDDFIIRGDNISGLPDGLIPAQSILGVITRIQRGHRCINFGLGLERYLLALLSRSNLLTPILNIPRNIKNLFLI